jgi:hypothetical protein
MHINLSNFKSGFSDRLRAVTYYVAVNKLLKNKNFYFITEKKTAECNFKFEDYCYIKNSKIIRNNRFKKSEISLNSYNSSINLKNCINNNCYKELDSKKLFLEWKKSYQKILPKKIIIKLINKLNLPKNYFSIHLRTTDKVIKLNNFIKYITVPDNIFDIQLNHYEKNFVKIIKKYTNRKNIFIAADDIELKKRIINLLKNNGYNVYYHNCKFNSKNLRQTPGKDFIVDLFCISKGELVISTVGAGVVKSAYYLSKEKLKVFIINNQFNRMFFLRILILLIFYLKRFKSIFFK